MSRIMTKRNNKSTFNEDLELARALDPLVNQKAYDFGKLDF